MSSTIVPLHNDAPNGTGCFLIFVVGVTVLVSFGVLLGVLLL